MNVFEVPKLHEPFELVQEHLRHVREYVLNAKDPNESGANGRNLLPLAIPFLTESNDDTIVADLLRRGADPNRPSPWATFTGLLTASNSITLVREFIDRGLRLNDVYDVPLEPANMPHGPSTSLEYALGIRDYISQKRKKPNALATKHAGRLGMRKKSLTRQLCYLNRAEQNAHPNFGINSRFQKSLPENH